MNLSWFLRFQLNDTAGPPRGRTRRVNTPGDTSHTVPKMQARCSAVPATWCIVMRGAKWKTSTRIQAGRLPKYHLIFIHLAQQQSLKYTSPRVLKVMGTLKINSKHETMVDNGQSLNWNRHPSKDRTTLGTAHLNARNDFLQPMLLRPMLRTCIQRRLVHNTLTDCLKSNLQYEHYF